MSQGDAIDSTGGLSDDVDLHRGVPARRFIFVDGVREIEIEIIVKSFSPALERQHLSNAFGAVEYLADSPAGKIDPVQVVGELLD